MISRSAIQKKTSAGKNSTQGYVLVFTIMLTGVLLLLSVGISNIIRKETILSGTVRESQFSFYAADAGLECALYWDNQYVQSGFQVFTAFATSSDTPGCPGGGAGKRCNREHVPSLGIFCSGGEDIKPNSIITSENANSASTKFCVTPVNRCASVTVTKTRNFTGPNFVDNTTVESRGYNIGTCDVPTQECVSTAPRRLERAIRVSY